MVRTRHTVYAQTYFRTCPCIIRFAVLHVTPRVLNKVVQMRIFNLKERDKEKQRKSVSADPRMWPCLSGTHFSVSIAQTFPVLLILPHGYEANNLSLTSVSIRIHIFSVDDLDMARSDCASSPALFMYMRIHVLAPTRLCRCISV